MYKKIENKKTGRKVFIKDLLSSVEKNNIAMLSSQTAFNLVVALVPFSVVVINLILFFASSQILTIQMYISKLPGELASLANDLFLFIVTQRNTGILSFGILITIWSSSKGVKALLKSLNKVFGIKANKNFLYTQIKSIIFTILLIVVILVMLGGVVFGNLIVDAIISFFKLEVTDVVQSLIRFLRIVIPLILMIFVFTSIYLFGPAFEKSNLPPFKPCFIGGIFATLGCTAITLLYSFYINNFANLSSVYGPLVGIMILFLWMNYTIMIIIFSGEISAAILRLNYEKTDNNTNNNTHNNKSLISKIKNIRTKKDDIK